MSLQRLFPLAPSRFNLPISSSLSGLEKFSSLTFVISIIYRRIDQFSEFARPFKEKNKRSIRYYQPFIAKLSIYLRIFEYFPSLFPRNPKPLPEKRLRRPFFRWWIKGKLSAQTIRASVRSVRGETLSSARLLRVHRSALSDNRIRTSRIKRGILLKLARQLLHFDPLFFLSFFFFARAA